MVCGCTMRPLGTMVLAGLVWSVVLTGAADAQTDDDPAALNAEVVRLYQAGKYAEATKVAERLLAIREKVLGPEHTDVARSLNNLAEVYRAQGRNAEAEPLYRRSLAIREKALGLEHPDVAIVLDNLAELYRAQGRYADAVPLYRRSLAIVENALGSEHPRVATALNNLAALYQAQARYPEAEPLYLRSLAIAKSALGSEYPAMATAVNNLAELYRTQGRYAEAEPLYHRSLAIRERALGLEHPAVATALNNLAELYRAQGRYPEAEPLYRRSLAIREKARGPEDPTVATTLNNLALLQQLQGRYPEAEPLYRRSLAIREKARGPEDPAVATALNNLAALYQAQARYADAEPLYRRSLAISEKALGPDHPGVATALDNLAALYRTQGRYAEAEPLYRRSLAISQKTLGPEHPEVAITFNNLAALYQAQGRYAEAEPLYRRGLDIREKALGLEHPAVATALNSLAELYWAQGRYAEAEPLYRRCLAIREKALGLEHPAVATTLNDLAVLYQAQARYPEVELLYRRSLTIREKALGLEHPAVATAVNNLAELYRVQGHYAEAEPLYRRSLAIREKALGPEHPDVGGSLNNLALLYHVQGRYAEAEPLYRRSLDIREKALGLEHPDVVNALNNLAWLALARGDWVQASVYWRRSTAVIQRRAQRGLASAAEGSAKGEAQRLRWQFWGLVKMTHRLAAPNPTTAVAVEMFEAAQWVQASEVAASLMQMAARSARGTREFAGLVRERQDLVSEWEAKDKLLIAAKSEPPAKRYAAAEQALAGRLAEIEARLAEISQMFARDFPDYAALSSPASVSVAEVQAQLSADEALVLFLDTDTSFKPLPEESFVWIVTKTDVRWERSELGTAALTGEVRALRCGLDDAAWVGDGAAQCATALGMAIPNKAPDPLPFSHARSHKLYTALFSRVQDLIKDKHLLIVPSGALTQLPFHVLMTQPPSSGDHPAAAWLARDHAITVLPAVSSLKALRRVGRPSAAPRPMIGFGNPLLTGYTGRADDDPKAKALAKEHAQWAKDAREKQHCPDTRPQQVAGHHSLKSSGAARVATRGGSVNLADIKGQVPLPETRDELCAVAEGVKAERGDIHLGARATENEIKRLSASGELAKYRMVHFATHGAVAGELTGTHEPGLILTPPETASEADDGYLSASEIAALKLDADWVVLSACNTAAGGATNAEALSGLGRAFIYAGARSLLVSHWAVDSEATVKLITGAVREMSRDPKVGRAEAIRRSMLALIDRGSKEEAHPAFWAPFVVVGEGAAGR
jgi:tetratricopeptide (TPR) repeat protein/CHAT domain-containing protein